MYFNFEENAIFMHLPGLHPFEKGRDSGINNLVYPQLNTILFNSRVPGLPVKLTYYPEPDIETIGVPPNTFGHLRICS
jgi:hypothetical protein